MTLITGTCVSRYLVIAIAGASIVAGAAACSTRVSPLKRLDPQNIEVSCEDTEEGCPEEEEESPCPEIEAVIDHCPGWSTSEERDSCGDLTPVQEGCVADILNDLADSGDECINWYEPRVICIGEHISLEGYASCAIQDCLGLTDVEECALAYEIQCGWTL